MTAVHLVDSPSSLAFSESFAALAKALVAAQGEMGEILKKKTAEITSEKARYKYTYADLASVLDAVQPALKNAKIAVVQNPSSTYDERGGVTITIETLLLHESGEWLRGRLDMRPLRGDPQSIGSAITYGRRYAVLALCGLAPEDDDAAAASKPAATQAHATTQPANNGHAAAAHNGHAAAAHNAPAPAVGDPVKRRIRAKQQRVFSLCSQMAWSEDRRHAELEARYATQSLNELTEAQLDAFTRELTDFSQEVPL